MAKGASMRKPNLAVVTAIILVLSVMVSAPAFARGGGGMGHGFAGAPVWQGSNPPGFSREMKTGWNGAGVPPGWNKGKKTGWKGQGVPPGLYGR